MWTSFFYICIFKNSHDHHVPQGCEWLYPWRRLCTCHKLSGRPQRQRSPLRGGMHCWRFLPRLLKSSWLSGGSASLLPLCPPSSVSKLISEHQPAIREHRDPFQDEYASIMSEDTSDPYLMCWLLGHCKHWYQSPGLIRCHDPRQTRDADHITLLVDVVYQTLPGAARQVNTHGGHNMWRAIRQHMLRPRPHVDVFVHISWLAPVLPAFTASLTL